MRRVYLDHNATTPVSEKAKQAIMEAMETSWGNPSSVSWVGKASLETITGARESVAKSMQCKATEVVFTSGGTESNNLALVGVVEGVQRERGWGPSQGHIITTDIEHPAVLNVLRDLEKRGVQVSYVKTGSTGVVSPEAIAAEIRDDTVLVSVMHANNETGCIQPVLAISQLLRKASHKVYLHTDAAQSIGKIPVGMEVLGVDLLSICSHKFYGPKGVGALIVREGTPLVPQLFGASQERGIRPGTESTYMIVGMAVALAEVTEGLEHSAVRMAEARDTLRSELAKGCSVSVNGDGSPILPNTLSCALSSPDGKFICGPTLSGRVSNQVAISTGSACNAKTKTTSYVLGAMGVPDAQKAATLRLSVGIHTTVDDVKYAAQVLLEAAREQWG